MSSMETRTHQRVMLSEEEAACVIEPRAMRGFVVTPFVKELTRRALTYIRAGFPVHFRGVAGTGKTTLAMHVAAELGRPVVLLHGDDQYTSQDLIGGEHGYRRRYLRDNFISSVLKIEEDMSKRWMDNRLTIACRNGLTLVYDEYTRSRPEANNVLLSILQEGVLDLPPSQEAGEAYVRVHPNFTAIFTSNPEEYAGVHKSQDALRDRMITLDLDFPDRETEVAITRAKARLPEHTAAFIVDLVRAVREHGSYDFAPTVRAGIMIGRAVRAAKVAPVPTDTHFRKVCQDILASETSRIGSGERYAAVRMLVTDLLDGREPAGEQAVPLRVQAARALAR